MTHAHNERTRSPDTFALSNAPHSSAANASVSGVPPNLFWANTLISGCAIVIASVAAAAAWWNAKEAKQVQVQLMYSNAILLRAGLVDELHLLVFPAAIGGAAPDRAASAPAERGVRSGAAPPRRDP